jgi:hypothetical protein
MPEYEITEHRYELVDHLPDGMLCRLVEKPGSAIVQFLRGDATKELMRFMTERHELILVTKQMWVQVWEPGAPRSEAPAQGLGIARARWQLLTPEEEARLPEPDAGIAVAGERDGVFVWFIRPPHVTQEAVDQWNRILERIVGDGLWQQRWNQGGDSLDGQ